VEAYIHTLTLACRLGLQIAHSGARTPPPANSKKFATSEDFTHSQCRGGESSTQAHKCVLTRAAEYK
jgi:hypothetical protein